MKLLEDKIKQNGIAVNEHILKVDSFINHQIDPILMQEMGQDIAEHFRDKGITKIATIESSGIAPALMTAAALNVPLIILKKQPSKILNQDLYQTVVTSFTKQTNYELTIFWQMERQRQPRSGCFACPMPQLPALLSSLRNLSSLDVKSSKTKELKYTPWQESPKWLRIILSLFHNSEPL